MRRVNAETTLTSSFLQTKDWAEFQRSLGRPVFDCGGTWVIKHELLFGRNYLYIPHGPGRDSGKNLISALKSLAEKEKAIFVKAEPLYDNVAQFLVAGGFRKSEKEIQPSRTVVVDLSQSGGDLLAVMHPKTRYNIKVAERHEIHVGESGDTQKFWRLLEKTAGRDKFWPHPQDYYFKLLDFFKNTEDIGAKLFLAECSEKPIAAAIVLLHGNVGYYLHGALDYGHRNNMAPYKLHWEIIKYLKNRGYQGYDLWGIDAKKWPGLTRFKLGWIGEGSTVAGTRTAGRHKSGISMGSQVIEHPGSFDLPIAKFWYLTYKLAREIF